MYRKKPAEARGRVIIADSARRIPPETLVQVTGMTMDELVRDIVNDRTGKYAKILIRKPTADEAAGE